ncbi:MAG: MerR family transcriptional regulator [Ktedonobacteraceae bacterium]|nr:MerR family transcriptional regulator [Ktedonobacteraceae bacterium]
MRISELAASTGVSQRSLRHYERQGLISSQRLENGYRDFDPAQIERVKTVQFYLTLGLTTAHIAKLMKCKQEQVRPSEYEVCEGLLAVYERKLEEAKAQISSLSELKDRLEKRIAFSRAARGSMLSSGKHEQ